MKAAFVIPGDIETLTGGYIYDRRVLDLLPSHGVDISLCRLPGGFPFPDTDDLAQTQTALARIHPDAIMLVDGLAWGALPPDVAGTLGPGVVALCHHPLGLEAGLTQQHSEAFLANERQTLALADHVIVTSGTTRDTLIDLFDLPAGRITVAEPGVDPAPRAKGSGGAPVLLAIGTVIPRKGYDVLIDACAQIADCDWRLVIAGSLERSPETARAMLAQIEACGLKDRITLAGEISSDVLENAYGTADVFVMSSHYEGYGMALAEALAHGLPIVTTTGGAMVSTVPDEAAIKVPPGDADVLAKALRQVVTDRNTRSTLAEAAWRAGQSLPRWNDTAATIAAVLQDVARTSR
ncbi:glycosyltransferase family 4 protein [Roseiarcaceae bacterium H3SJ34-1]|uniref:glycosyltransferase family 4 protein n=1 Tax=Terripilifer ovatus TaxID=3032367 RepID=UPI003AB91B88|nr:glycosyltransferase family 4 protein [Roseiarcaceae bacterium H3SJ34-1]